MQIKLNDITPKILDNVSGSLHQLNEYLKLRFLNSETLLTILQRSCQPVYKAVTPPPQKKKSDGESSVFFTFMHVFRGISPNLVLLVPCGILPMSSSSDVIDLERRAMAGGVSLLVCCGAAKRSQPNADIMFSTLV